MDSNNSLIRFVLIMCVLVALVLSGMYTFLKPIHDVNEALYNKKALLSAVNDHLSKDVSTMTNEEIQSIFDNNIKQSAIKHDGEVIEDISAFGYSGLPEEIDLGKERKKSEVDQILPIMEYSSPEGKKFYIVSVRGKGLWDEIWGNIALESDLNTIAGVAFDHKAETPGLGAEIKDNSSFKKQFVGKKLYDDDLFRSVLVRKGGAKNDTYEVDAISGATITGDGVTEMLSRGLKYYEPYFEKIKSNS